MNGKDIIISVIIVNYNVKDFLEQSLESVKRALKDINSEIIVVDNNSVDGSVQMLDERFPDTHVIVNNENVGFACGNNLAIKKARGTYIVLLNPDTLVQENTFLVLLNFFQNTPDASAATCKILNPDGTFSIDCRHSIPTPLTAFWKIIGLNRLFPKSKIFGKYNLTYLDENETYPVDAISGSFMMIRKEIVDRIGLLDESFFMYCEDIDYCHRINQAGGRIYYFPDTQIIHYKGESTKVNQLDYIITFNKSLYQFYKKHYTQKYIYPFKWLILLGITIRGTIIYFKNTISRYYPIILDLIILNVSLFFTFWGRFAYKDVFNINDFFHEYIVINIITSVTYIGSALFYDLLEKGLFFREKVFKVLFTTFLFVAALTAFFKQFAFSRLVVLIAAIVSSVIMVGWRIIVSRSALNKSALRREFFIKKALIVGEDKGAENLLLKLDQRMKSGLNIAGVVSLKNDHIGREIAGYKIVTSLEKLEEYVRIKKIDIIIFSTQNIPYELILKTMINLQGRQVEFKMVPGHLEFMIGKSNVEKLDTMPLVDIQYAYGKTFNQLIKRIFDLCLSSLIIPIMLPVYIYYLFLNSKTEILEIQIGQLKTKIFKSKKSLGNFALNVLNIWLGKMSFIGAPLEHTTDLKFRYKPGITGLVQINKDKLNSENAKENYELFYLKSQSIFLDIEILFTAIFKS